MTVNLDPAPEPVPLTIGVLTRLRPDTALLCLGALVPQLDEGVSLLVVVNGSDDNTMAVLAAAVPQARLIESPSNLGCPGGRNRIASLAATEWVAFIDDDGIVAPDFVSRLRSNIAAHPEAAVIAGCAVDALHAAPETFAAGPAGVFSGGICALNVAQFLAVGGYHEDGVRQGEETEYAIRLHERGRLIWRDPKLTLQHDADLSPGKRREVARTGMRQSMLTGVKFCPLYALIPWLGWKALTYVIAGVRTRELAPVVAGLADAARVAPTAWSARAPVHLRSLLQASGRHQPVAVAAPATRGNRLQADGRGGRDVEGVGSNAYAVSD